MPLSRIGRGLGLAATSLIVFVSDRPETGRRSEPRITRSSPPLDRLGHRHSATFRKPFCHCEVKSLLRSRPARVDTPHRAHKRNFPTDRDHDRCRAKPRMLRRAQQADCDHSNANESQYETAGLRNCYCFFSLSLPANAVTGPASTASSTGPKVIVLEGARCDANRGRLDLS